uniref:Signal transduction histidine kinase, glucose-6-phosphate specific n=1 Tax=Rhodopseudomonas palustris (strain BisA53) TaxID=316055 RepID=Q07MS8_RHOP5
MVQGGGTKSGPMWQGLSLRARLNALLALVLLLGLSVNIARLGLEAAPRIQAEDQSVVRLAREFIKTLVDGLSDTPDPEARLTRMLADLTRLRHVSITRENATTPAPASPAAVDGTPTPPSWFVRLVHPAQTTISVPVNVDGRSFGSLVITSHPIDEMNEIWDGIVTQIEIGAAVAVLLLLITMTVVSRALTPIQSLAEAMASIEAGHYGVRVELGGPPELAAICAKLNHLAGVLGAAIDDKRRLAARVVSLQDAERKEIARELHDEFGPFLFALRAHAGSLTRMAALPSPDIAALQKHGAAMLEQINALQRSNRRVLERLRPAGLSELGLVEALQALARLWRETHPDVAIVMAVSPSLPVASEIVELTIYRVVQEALTNVFRHAGATRVEVTIEAFERSTAEHHGSAVRVRVEDDGIGLPADHKLGHGLTGMRERVMALGGTMTLSSADRGMTLGVVIPMASPA